VLERGVIVVAADSGTGYSDSSFPATLDGVIGVRSTGSGTSLAPVEDKKTVLAPGEKIMVALPDDNYDFRSGSSLAAAHVTGVIALLLAESPEQNIASVERLLHESQKMNLANAESVDACMVLYLADGQTNCPRRPQAGLSSKLKSGS